MQYKMFSYFEIDTLNVLWENKHCTAISKKVGNNVIM